MPNSDLLIVHTEIPEGRAVPQDIATYKKGNVHLCVVCDDIRAVYERLKDKDAFADQPVRITFGVNEGLNVYFAGVHGMYCELF